MKQVVNGIMRELPPQLPDEPKKPPKTPEQLAAIAFWLFALSLAVPLVFQFAALVLKSRGS